MESTPVEQASITTHTYRAITFGKPESGSPERDITIRLGADFNSKGQPPHFVRNADNEEGTVFLWPQLFGCESNTNDILWQCTLDKFEHWLKRTDIPSDMGVCYCAGDKRVYTQLLKNLSKLTTTFLFSVLAEENTSFDLKRKKLKEFNRDFKLENIAKTTEARVKLINMLRNNTTITIWFDEKKCRIVDPTTSGTAEEEQLEQVMVTNCFAKVVNKYEKQNKYEPRDKDRGNANKIPKRYRVKIEMPAPWTTLTPVLQPPPMQSHQPPATNTNGTETGGDLISQMQKICTSPLPDSATSQLFHELPPQPTCMGCLCSLPSNTQAPEEPPMKRHCVHGNVLQPPMVVPSGLAVEQMPTAPTSAAATSAQTLTGVVNMVGLSWNVDYVLSGTLDRDVASLPPFQPTMDALHPLVSHWLQDQNAAPYMATYTLNKAVQVPQATSTLPRLEWESGLPFECAVSVLDTDSLQLFGP
eukprot:TRINITY_DN124_c0_g1_i1.p1 TRINITY_DN124_c0_g1~~TRINITY_DN124_c0_g1_i1.p1  ORF type:complete len:472 (-),score=41.11 TRINITY_DN124_c0_g1_i1:106-1521(-)